MVDVTDVNGARVGDEVVLFGSPTLTADEAAGWLGTINYEVVCMISPRVPRVYVEDK
jgi:alanine racemase